MEQYGVNLYTRSKSSGRKDGAIEFKDSIAVMQQG